MKKAIKALLLVVIMLLLVVTPTYAKENETENETKVKTTNQTASKTTNTNKNETLKPVSTTRLLELENAELKSIEDYKAKYGSDTYGVTAYILDKVRIFSIPLVFIGIAFSAIYQYVIGIKKLDVRDKGFNSMIAIITIGIICQILPLVFAIVVTSTEK